MAIKGLFFNAIEYSGTYDREYSADDFCSWLNQIVGNGVFPSPSNQLQVVADSGMSIDVLTGEGWINGHKIVNTAAYPLTVAAADALLTRIDRVIFYVDYTDREMGIDIIKGTAASSPTAPALTRTTTRYEMALADITIPKQTTEITQAMITDMRANSTVCGWAAGIIDQIDTSSLFTQWQTAYADYYAAVKSQLDDFMETLTEELAVNTYVVEYSKTVTVTPTTAADQVIALDMTGYTYEDTDIINVYINGLKGVLGTDFTITGSGTSRSVTISSFGPSSVQNTIEVSVYKSVIGIAQAITT